MSENAKIAKRTGIVAFFTFLSRISGLVRDAVVASVFGTAQAADAFYVAFRIPNLLRRLVGEGSLTSAFVPVFTDTLKEGAAPAKRLVDSCFTLLSLLLVAIVIIGVLGSELWISH